MLVKIGKGKKIKCFKIIGVVSFYEGASTNFVKLMGYNDNSLLQIHPTKTMYLKQNRTILDSARSMAMDAQLSNYLWPKAINTTTYLTTHSPSKSNVGLTP
jgi:hypothetical protein